MRQSNPSVVVTAALLGLALLCLAARSFAHSSRHFFPVFDEVSHLDIARDFSNRGGILPTVGGYVRGEVREANRHPLYLLMLSALVDHSARDFARAKLLTLATCCFLVLAVFFLVERTWGYRSALLTSAAVSLSPISALLSQQVLADVLFSVFYFGAILLLVHERKSLSAWIGFGVLSGLAYLTKGNGFFLFASAFLCGFWRYRLSFLRTPPLYAALGFFALVSSFLLLRNLRVWHNPFYNFNNKIVWLDHWDQLYLYAGTDVWNQIGVRWFLAHHTGLQMIQRLAAGMRLTAFMLILSMSFLFQTPGSLLWTGCVALGLAIFGMYRRWRDDRRLEVLAIGGAGTALFLAFSWSALATESNWRFTYPIAVSLMPMSVLGAKHLLPAPLRSFLTAGWTFETLVGLLLVVCLSLSWRALRANPLDFFFVPDYWLKTSQWIDEHSDAHGFLVNHRSKYSTWWRDKPQMIRGYPFEISRQAMSDEIERTKVQYALLDATLLAEDPFSDKYGASDAAGPLTFAGWPRCFHDDLRPSIFLIYSPRCSEAPHGN